MSDIDILAQDLRSSLTAEQLITDPHTLSMTNIDGLEPRLIALPETSEQVADIVTRTNFYGFNLLTCGGGVRMSLGAMPERFDVLLDMRRLSRLLEHHVNEARCRVEAGMMLSTLQKLLAKRGQRLALDPPEAEQTSIGGLLATDVCGPLCFSHGTIQDLVTDVRVVRANGIIESDRSSIGALGTLGVIVEAQFRLDPLPVSQHTLLLTYVHVTDAMNTVLALLTSPLKPDAIELIDAGAASDLSNFFGINMPTNGYTLALLFEGDATIVEQRIDALQSMARTYNAFLADDLQAQKQHDFWNALRNHTQGTLTCNVSLPVSEIVPFTQQIEHTCARYNLESALVAHAGNGILYVELRPGDAIHRVLDAISALQTHAHTAHGTLFVERCPIDLRRRIATPNEQGVSTIQNEWPHLPSIQQARETADPKRTFARGNALA